MINNMNSSQPTQLSEADVQAMLRQTPKTNEELRDEIRDLKIKLIQELSHKLDALEKGEVV